MGNVLLAIDVGNTHTVIGVYQDETLTRHWRLVTDASRTADEYGVLLWNLHRLSDVAIAAGTAAIVCSVVPPMTTVMEDVCRAVLGTRPLVVGPGVKTGMPILYDNPKEVGADRICNAVAAYERYHQACIVVDFGTATTFDCISRRGEYLGGVITPGLGISLDALVTRTAKLPRVEMVKPPKVVGKTTVHAMQAGLIYGYVSLVDGLVDRIRGEVDADARVLATGGLAGLLTPESRTIETADEFLTLDGLRLIHRRNQ
jgi:type III pantothenate kinase